MDQQKLLIKRINELANKPELTEEEKSEQQRLRKAYLVNFRKSFKQQLDQVKR